MALTLAYFLRKGVNGYVVPGMKHRPVRDLDAACRVYRHLQEQADFSPSQITRAIVMDGARHVATITHNGKVIKGRSAVS